MSPITLSGPRSVIRALATRPRWRSDGSRNGRSYVVTLLTPITPGAEADLAAYLAGLCSDESPLAKLPYVHFGRWVVVDRLRTDYPGAPSRPSRLKSQYLLFTATITAPAEEHVSPPEERYGERLPESFLHELRARIPDDADAIWGHCLGYPGSSDADRFVRYLAAGQLKGSFVYTGYRDVTVDEVRRALAARDGLVAFARSHQDERDAAHLQRAYLEESSTWFPSH